MIKASIKCVKCLQETKESASYKAKCGHLYCIKCIDQITAEGGANCSEMSCSNFLNIADLMNRQFQKLSNSNQMVFGKQVTMFAGDPKKLASPSQQNKATAVKQNNQNLNTPRNQQKNTLPRRSIQERSPVAIQTKSKSQMQKVTDRVLQQQNSAKMINPKQQQTQQRQQAQVIPQQQVQQPKQQQQKLTQQNVYIQPQKQEIKVDIDNRMTESFSYKCDYCHSNNSGLFHNEICDHRLCYDCIQKYYDDYCVCFVKDCGWQINQEQLNQFMLTYVTFQLGEVEEVKLKRQQSSNDQQDILISKFQFEEVTLQHMQISNMNEFIKTFDELKIKEKNYIDLRFGPNDKSVGSNYSVTWQRLNVIFNGDYQFFAKANDDKRFGLGKYIGPQDIIQGQLGNCYLLASISALGNRRPDLLLDVFITRAINEQGIYCIRLCIDGIWKAIYVDDYFPVYPNLTPIFTKAKNNAIWVMVLEKAWAKLFGSYQNSAAGSMQEVLRALTGAPTEVIWTQSPDFIAQLRRCLANKVIMVAATQSSDIQPITQGLVPNHAYSVLKIRQINHPKRGQVELLKLRNPWGKKEWTGDWGQDSPLWTPQLRQELKLDKEDSGVFYMDVGSFMQQFRDIHICHIKQDYQYSATQIKSSKKKAVYYSFKITKEGDYYITINQRNQRWAGNPKYSNAKLLICKKEENHTYTYIAGKLSQFGEVWCKCTLTKGEYVVFAKVIWEHHQEFFFVLSSYGIDKLEFKQIKKIPEMLPSVLIKKGLVQQPKRSYDTMGQPKIQSCYNLDRLDGWGYYFIDNQSNVKLISKISFHKFYGLKFCKPHRGVTLNIELAPGKQFIAVIKVLSGYEIEFTQKVQFQQ
ncbi:unnamed protein product (macronuclear) [Paramecium tetraurelia]|uniref:Calpain catalytic domain-containing protein n=1 Tax=Paramecium tetraurelia TaxID=5888 RepID=A0DKW2_PARTE|nr:uncharacterized protein GSPATT00017996001 [Paramecium tetraurelia]CAK83679.1 unnamed protein product [Paramecium tetraurelia]|eukprot:XP_001451076.1 hypothetical protein (macronuclear) [Paramecium tetraurelia strain d4-2]